CIGIFGSQAYGKTRIATDRPVLRGGERVAEHLSRRLLLCRQLWRTVAPLVRSEVLRDVDAADLPIHRTFHRPRTWSGDGSAQRCTDQIAAEEKNRDAEGEIELEPDVGLGHHQEVEFGVGAEPTPARAGFDVAGEPKMQTR